MISYLRHAGRVADRTEHGSSLLPGMNATPEIDRTVVNLDPQTFGLAISAKPARISLSV